MSESSSQRCRVCGFTLMEMLVTLVLLSILASVAMPYAELTVRRTKEIELHRALRKMRTAIDYFHQDWVQGLIPPTSGAASRDGYPRHLAVLTKGILLTNGDWRKYLRSIPRDPFADPTIPAASQWRLIGYREKPDAIDWNGEDIYDIRSRSDQQAIDKSFYRNW